MNKSENISLSEQLNALREKFMDAGNPSKIESMAAYMKNKFEYAGLPKPVRETIVKPWLKSISDLSWRDQMKASTWLWKQEEREFQYVAMELLFKNKKNWTEESLEHFEKLITTKSWWDTVDYIAASLVALYFERYPSSKNKKIKEWIKSKNMWLNRTAIIFQLKYRNKTDLDLLFQSILPHLKSNEFFIQKAIGWSLRQYAYTDPKTVIKFVKGHDLKPLSKREAMKHF